MSSKRTVTERSGNAVPVEDALVRRIRSLLPSTVTRYADRVPSVTASPNVLHSADDADGETTDEELVHEFLDANGGRVKQATIASRTDWSEAKVSRLLSSMEAAGDIERYRIGREKVVTRPDS